MVGGGERPYIQFTEKNLRRRRLPAKNVSRIRSPLDRDFPDIFRRIRAILEYYWRVARIGEKGAPELTSFNERRAVAQVRLALLGLFTQT